MSGYTAVFSKIYDGTLYGKWPDAPLFASLLPLADKNGVISHSWEALAGKTGWPMELLRQGIASLMGTDIGSESQELEGRRLVPHNQHGGKTWGWLVVNHGKYREKARLAQREVERVRSGENAKRMAERRGPPVTPADPPSDTDTNTDPDKRSEAIEPPEQAQRSRYAPDDFSPDKAWAQSKADDMDVDLEVEKFKNHEFPKAYKDWNKVWHKWVLRAVENDWYAKKKPTKAGGWPSWKK